MLTFKTETTPPPPVISDSESEDGSFAFEAPQSIEYPGTGDTPEEENQNTSELNEIFETFTDQNRIFIGKVVDLFVVVY